MFIQHKAEYINVQNIVKIKKATSENNRFAQRDFYKLILSLINDKDIDLDFDSEEELEQFLEKLEILK